MYSSEAIPRYGSEDEFDIDDPFWEFIDEPKYFHEEEEIEEEIVGKEVEETESDTQDKHGHNLEDESDYDGDDEKE